MLNHSTSSFHLRESLFLSARISSIEAHHCLVAETQVSRSIFLVTSYAFIVIHRVKLLRHLCEVLFSIFFFATPQNVQKFFFHILYFLRKVIHALEVSFVARRSAVCSAIRNKNAKSVLISTSEKK
jgi:hypothetical protein